MKVTIKPIQFARVCGALIASDAKTAFQVIDTKTVVRATWRFKPKANSRREELVVTFGVPNYLEAKFIRQCRQAGEPLPVKKIQFRAWPKKAVKK